MTLDPREAGPKSFPNEPQQPGPGLETAMRTKPDHGEETYVGRNSEQIAIRTAARRCEHHPISDSIARETQAQS